MSRRNKIPTLSVFRQHNMAMSTTFGLVSCCCSGRPGPLLSMSAVPEWKSKAALGWLQGCSPAQRTAPLGPLARGALPAGGGKQSFLLQHGQHPAPRSAQSRRLPAWVPRAATFTPPPPPWAVAILSQSVPGSGHCDPRGCERNKGCQALAVRQCDLARCGEGREEGAA